METSREPQAGPSPGRDRVHAAIVLNQLATPGLGSWMAGRRLAGLGQLLLSVAGFCLFVAYMGLLIWRSLRAFSDGSEPERPPGWLWQSGVVVFGVAWVWSGVTGIQLWRASRRAPAMPPVLPPTPHP